VEETFGRYRLLERLGTGGMAEVFKAKSFGVEGFEKTLVIKRILPALALNPSFVELFVREAKLAVRLSHANIVQVFDLGKVDARRDEPPSYYMAMELVPGLDLASLLAWAREHGRQLPIGLVLYVVSEVAKGLDHAHRRRDDQSRLLGIVHRDVSPHNVLLSWEGEVKVTDFGIAKARAGLDTLSRELDDTTLAGASIGADPPTANTITLEGKLAYMSPEQARGEEVDPRSDLFSLGVVLYELCTRVNPFSSGSMLDTLRRVRAAEVPPVELLRDDTPPALADLVRRLLHREPASRPEGAARVHEEVLGMLYELGHRFHASDLAAFLLPLRGERAPTSPADDIAGRLLRPHYTDADATPVETPASLRRAAPASVPFSGAGPLLQRRDVTALAVAWSEARGQAGLRERAIAALGRCGGTIAQEGASGAVALFGLGASPDGRDAETAVRAAFTTLRELGPSATPAAGIEVGRVHVAAPNPSQACELTHDETLDRLCAAAMALAPASSRSVVVSPLAARVLRGAFELGPDEGLGKRVLSTRRHESVTERFVGRQPELRRFGELLARAARGTPSLVWVWGPCGIGKSRLVFEVERRMNRSGYDLGYFATSCGAAPAAAAEGSAVVSMLRSLCAVDEALDPAKLRELEPRLRALGLVDWEVEHVLRSLGPSAESSDDRGTSLAAFRRMVQELSEDRLHCLVWDDAHAIDATSLEVLEGLVGRSGARVVVVLCSREPPADVCKGLGRAPPTAELLELAPLPTAEVARLLSNRLGHDVGTDVIELFEARAGGNPLHLEELARDVAAPHDAWSLSHDGGTGTLRSRLAEREGVPRTLRALLVTRLGRLSLVERELLEASSTIAERSTIERLAALVVRSEAEVERAAASLESQQLLRRTSADAFEVSSPAVADVAREELAPAARAEWHRRAAELDRAGDGVDAKERAARHYALAVRRDDAQALYQQVARQRSDLGQLGAALAAWTSALELTRFDGANPSEVCEGLEAVEFLVTRVRVAPRLQALIEPAVAAVGRGSLAERARAHLSAAKVHAALADFASVERHLHAAEALTDELEAAGPDERALAGSLRTRRTRAVLLISTRRGDVRRALVAADALEAGGESLDPRALLAVAHVRAASGQVTRAYELVEQAARRAPPSDRALQSDVAKQRVLIALLARDYASAVQASAEAVERARESGIPYELAAALHNLGDAAHRSGDHRRAYAALTESLRICVEASIERIEALNRLHLAYLDAIRGDAQAEATLVELVDVAEARGLVADGLEGRLLHLAALRARGANRFALAAARAAYELADRTQQAQAMAELSELLAELAPLCAADE
jgi:serine/threonine protein kinase